jgi:DivIVA domain-containing protein
MIDLTPLDVRKKKGDFARGLRGYDVPAVDQFLELAADRMEELVRDNAALSERVSQISASLSAYRDREQAMNEALVAAQQLREDLRTQSTRESESVMREARVEADRIIAEARRTAQEAAEATRRVYAARSRFLRSYRAFLERQIDEVASEEDRVRDGMRPPKDAAIDVPASGGAEALRPSGDLGLDVGRGGAEGLREP